MKGSFKSNGEFLFALCLVHVQHHDSVRNIYLQLKKRSYYNTCTQIACKPPWSLWEVHAESSCPSPHHHLADYWGGGRGSDIAGRLDFRSPGDSSSAGGRLLFKSDGGTAVPFRG